MADRFDQFTERARRVLTLAQEEALRFNHNYIGTEHLLLGLVREGEGVAAQALAQLGLELTKVRNEVELFVGRGDRAVMGEIKLTPRAKKTIELTFEEARTLGQHHIGTEHLILGLTKVDDGRAARVFKNLGVSLDDARAEVMRLVTRPATDEPVARRPGAREPAIVIDGKAIAAQVREEAKQRSDKLHERGITPGLALVLVGDDPSRGPATPAGIVELLHRSGYPPNGKHVVVCGRSNIVGKPVAAILMQKNERANATVTLCHTGTPDLATFTRQADILIAAMGSPNAITAAMVKPGAVVIDVGNNWIEDETRQSGRRLVGDVDFEGVRQVASTITPVPGGVGPMTVAMLLSNTVMLAEQQAGRH